jgi:SprT protein
MVEEAALTEQVRELLAVLECPLMAAKAQVCWHAGLRSTAGRACLRTGRIELNPRLLKIGGAHVERTLRHEVAHLAAHERAAGRKVRMHGPEWQQCCVELGIAGEPAFHDLPLDSRQVFYECPHCKDVVERARRFSRTTACYSCCQRYNGGSFDARFTLRELPARLGGDSAP